VLYNSAQLDFWQLETVARARLGSKAFRWHCFADLYPPNVGEKKVVVSSLFGNYPVNGEVPALAVTISGIHVHNERDRAQGDRGSQGGRKSVRRTNRIVLPASSAHIRFFMISCQIHATRWRAQQIVLQMRNAAVERTQLDRSAHRRGYARNERITSQGHNPEPDYYSRIRKRTRLILLHMAANYHRILNLVINPLVYTVAWTGTELVLTSQNVKT